VRTTASSILFISISFLAAIGCVGNIGGNYHGVNKANYDKIRYGMSPDEINQILGPPAGFDDFDAMMYSIDKVREYKWETLANVLTMNSATIRIWGTKTANIQVMFMDEMAISKRQEGL
jgi:hypothetical protein